MKKLFLYGALIFALVAPTTATSASDDKAVEYCNLWAQPIDVFVHGLRFERVTELEGQSVHFVYNDGMWRCVNVSEMTVAFTGYDISEVRAVRTPQGALQWQAVLKRFDLFGVGTALADGTVVYGEVVTKPLSFRAFRPIFRAYKRADAGTVFAGHPQYGFMERADGGYNLVIWLKVQK